MTKSLCTSMLTRVPGLLDPTEQALPLIPRESTIVSMISGTPEQSSALLSPVVPQMVLIFSITSPSELLITAVAPSSFASSRREGWMSIAMISFA